MPEMTMADYSAIVALSEENKRLRQRVEELEDERSIFARTLNKRDRQMERLIGAIPAYEPPPCECCQKFTDYYAAECDCGNTGDHEAAVRWCVRMDVADTFQKTIDTTMEAEK